MKETKETASRENDAQAEAEKREANTCVALGAGVGALGAGAALAAGAVCPLCVVIAPGLIGAGIVKHWKISRQNKGDKHD